MSTNNIGFYEGLSKIIPYLHYVNVSVLIKFSQKTSVFTLIIISSPLNQIIWMCIRIPSVRRF